jgi:hypothetical protein
VSAAQAGLFDVACLMAAESIEAALIAQAYVFEAELREVGLWEIKKQSPIKITDVLDGEVGDAAHFVRYLRNVAAHPGKHADEVPRLDIADEVFERLTVILDGLRHAPLVSWQAACVS